MGARTGGELLVASLVAQGATHAFCVPGESFLPVLDAFHDVRDRIRFVACRQLARAAVLGGAVEVEVELGHVGDGVIEHRERRRSAAAACEHKR
mgnify:CR=1 FL=1